MRVDKEDKEWMVYSRDPEFLRKLEKMEAGKTRSQGSGGDDGLLFVVGFIIGVFAWIPLYWFFGFLCNAGVIPDWYIYNPLIGGSFLFAGIIFILLVGSLIAVVLKQISYDLGVGFFLGIVVAPVFWLIILPLLFGRRSEKGG